MSKDKTALTPAAPAIIPRQFRSFMQHDYTLKSGLSSSLIEMPDNVIVNGMWIYITMPYSVGATAPTGLMAAKAYGVLSRIVVENSRPDGRNWDIESLAIRKLCTMFKGLRIPEPAFDLATNGGAKEVTVPVYLDFTSPKNPFTIYQTGFNTYTKKGRVRLDWNENMNADQGIYAVANNFAVDKENIKVRVSFNQHTLQEGDELLKNPGLLLMRNLSQKQLNFSQAGRYSEELEQLRDYTYIHIAAVKKADSGGLISATDEIFSDFKLIDLSNSTGSNAQTFIRSSWYDLKNHTVEFTGEAYSALEAGYRTFSLIDDHRIAQAVAVKRNGDVNLNFEELKAVSSHKTYLNITSEYLTKQD